MSRVPTLSVVTRIQEKSRLKPPLKSKQKLSRTGSFTEISLTKSTTLHPLSTFDTVTDEFLLQEDPEYTELKKLHEQECLEHNQSKQQLQEAQAKLIQLSTQLAGLNTTELERKLQETEEKLRKITFTRINEINALNTLLTSQKSHYEELIGASQPPTQCSPSTAVLEQKLKESDSKLKNITFNRINEINTLNSLLQHQQQEYEQRIQSLQAQILLLTTSS